jgi:hypothetical protein
MQNLVSNLSGFYAIYSRENRNCYRADWKTDDRRSIYSYHTKKLYKYSSTSLYRYYYKVPGTVRTGSSCSWYKYYKLPTHLSSTTPGSRPGSTTSTSTDVFHVELFLPGGEHGNFQTVWYHSKRYNLFRMLDRTFGVKRTPSSGVRVHTSYE